MENEESIDFDNKLKYITRQTHVPVSVVYESEIL